MERVAENSLRAIASPIKSSCMGNIIEWYDFGLFSIFANLFSKLFFPETSAYTAQLATFGVFAVGFLCRPVGALIFGFLGDKKGRSKTLRFSILMISIPTLLIGILPTFEQAGIIAPILLIIIRMWQGISVGGEYSGNLIYLAESAPVQFRGIITSLASSGSNLGILLASLTGFVISSVLPEELLINWGWRIPYILSGLFCITIYFTRLNLPETKIYNYLKNENLLPKNPLQELCKNHFIHLCKTFGLVCMGSTFYYFCFIYLSSYLVSKYHSSVSLISFSLTAFTLLMIFLVPLAGMICDKLGRRKMLLFNACLITCITIPGFYFLSLDKSFLLIIILFVFTLASSLEQGATPVSIVENFPASTRYLGVSLGYNLGNGILGGTVPIICTWLETNTVSFSPAIYIALCAFITFLTAYFFVPETNKKNLIFI